MRRKVVSTLICAMMIFSGSVSFTQNVGESENVGQSQNNGETSTTSGGSGGLADSPWPMFSCNAQRTGLSPFNTSGNPGKLIWSFSTSFWIQSSPIIDSDGTIYIHNNNNSLYAINSDGTEKWIISISRITLSTPITLLYGVQLPCDRARTRRYAVLPISTASGVIMSVNGEVLSPY